MKKNILIAILLVIAATTWAQPCGMPCPAGGAPGPMSGMDEETAQKLRNMRKMRLLEELNLTDEQSDKFLPLLTRFDKNRSQIEKDMGETMRTVKDLLDNQKSDDALISKAIEKLEDQRKRIFDLETSLYDDSESILKPRQQIILMTFEPRFQQEMRGMLKQFMGKDRPDDKKKNNK